MTAKKPTLKYKTGEVVRELRHKRRVKQSEFWKKIGVTQSGGSRYESGRNIPLPVQHLLQIAYGTPAQAEALVEWLRGADS